MCFADEGVRVPTQVAIHPRAFYKARKTVFDIAKASHS